MYADKNIVIICRCAVKATKCNVICTGTDRVMQSRLSPKTPDDCDERTQWPIEPRRQTTFPKKTCQSLVRINKIWHTFLYISSILHRHKHVIFVIKLINFVSPARVWDRDMSYKITNYMSYKMTNYMSYNKSNCIKRIIADTNNTA